jgi:subtilisin family serine protease
MWMRFFVWMLLGALGAVPAVPWNPAGLWPQVSVAAAGSLGEDPRDHRGRLLYRPGELLVTFVPEATETQMAALHRRAGATVAGRGHRNRLHRVHWGSSRAALAAMSRYRASAAVAHVERHARRYPQRVPDDPLYGQQWGLDRIKAPAAWEFGTGGAEPIIAVIDSGADYRHPDLAGNIWVNPAERHGTAGVDDDGNGFADDLVGWDFAGASGQKGDPDPSDGAASGHGTHVAGIIAATGDNAEGIAGVCWTARLMPLKVKADNDDDYDTFHIIAALDYARDQGARIVNCSFGGPTYSESEYQAIQRLGDQGALVVCAAGNGGVNLDHSQPLYPASYDLACIITVAAATRGDELAAFSSWGPSSVDVMAPGEAIRSTVPSATEAAVVAGETRHPAIGLLYAALTGRDGVAGPLAVCGEGYPDQFPAGQAGYVALVWRSDAAVEFGFAQKTANARAAGAAAVIIANNRVDNLDQEGGTLGAPDDWPPAVTVTRSAGEALVLQAGQHVAVVHHPYAYSQGTSMAVPHVSGLAGLIWARDGSLSAGQVKAAILDGVDPIAAVSGKLVSGGRINAQQALCIAAGVSGDLNCDGRTGLADAILAGRQLAGGHPFACRPCLAAGTDPVPDGLVSPADVAAILQQVAGLR